MNLRFLLLVFVMSVLCEDAICQKDPDTELTGKAQATPSNLSLAKFQINDVKTRGIIVRLKTNKDRIAAYKKAGNVKVATKMEEEARETNLLLMDAFVCHWTYCPVYFMESQNTLTLLQKDTLIAKTYDLLSDTAIYMNHDSVYFIDYGVLMANEPPSDNTKFKDLNKTEESNNPVSEGCLVVKDGRSKQLQYPFPYFTKLSLINIGSKGHENISDLVDISAKDLFYNRRLELMKMGIKGQRPRDIQDSVNRTFAISFNYIIKYHSQNKYEKSVARLNYKFIEYFCKRLDKDKDILCNDDPYYWWQRNPNIPYLIAIPQLEVQLKLNTFEDPKFTK